jgi:hypothetical protein
VFFRTDRQPRHRISRFGSKADFLPIIDFAAGDRNHTAVLSNFSRAPDIRRRLRSRSTRSRIRASSCISCVEPFRTGDLHEVVVLDPSCGGTTLVSSEAFMTESPFG